MTQTEKTPAESPPAWEFWIDVGGTFTDCIARSPDNQLLTTKTLSSGTTKGRVHRFLDPRHLEDPSRTRDGDHFWDNYHIRLLDAAGNAIWQSEVAQFNSATGVLELSQDVEPAIQQAAVSYELQSDEQAPILAIRRILNLGLEQPIPPVSVRLGTTRGTNALLTRTGARSAFITTRGFRDVLLIANQDRPRLFDLAIQKPSPLFECTIEIEERLNVDGSVNIAADPAQIKRQLTILHQQNIDSIAICLLHSFANNEHEHLVERIAREIGFSEISTSSRLAPLIKIVSRGDTTMMDAYLNPILRDYVNQVRGSLSETAPDTHTHDLKMMTSAGGLVDADRFVGKDSILSGPAGGVIGFSRVAERAGFDKSIGFDMGGTSTDVSRFDGKYELEYETVKAGVRVVAPMLAIETVAAGGGSICGFDGVKLSVGPDSAGADPGPACYGRGGPLTVTDVNLHLGHILPEHFPFPLDRNAVADRLQALCSAITDSPLGRQYTATQLAEGFLNIANANMVRAIRKISVAKGYDPADYVLVTFGGAGAQHACGLARALGISRILIHPFAGILSAYGIGMADVRRYREQSILNALNAENLQSVQHTLQSLETTARQEVLDQGIAANQLCPATHSLDLRYQGVENTINVERPPDGDYASAYERLHQQLYGYTHSNRQIEITAARVEVVGRIADPPEQISESIARDPDPRDTVDAWFDGRSVSTAVYLREDLQAGDQLRGPAIVCEPTSTVVIEPDFQAVITPRQEILITANAQSGTSNAESGASQPVSSDADPVLLEIFNNLFASIAEQMGITLQQTSFSTNVKERLDYSCAVFDPVGNLVVNAPHIPVHLGAMSESVRCVIQDNPAMAAGDVFVTNDPYHGGSHLPDVTVVTPVHDEQTDEVLFFTASRAHHAEIGGIVPGSMPPFSTNLGEEGVLIRNFKLIDQGRSRIDAFETLLTSGPYPTRSVRDNLADVSAQVAANNNGVRQLQELVARYSLRVVQDYMRHIQRAAAEKMRLALSRIPDGQYALTDHLDDGSPIAVAIAIADDRATVDFSGTGPVLSTNLNANRAITTAAVLYVFRCLIDEDIPLNSGVLEPVDILLPECLLNPPEHPDPHRAAAVVGGNVETSQRVVDTLLGALKMAAASQGTMNNLTFGNDSFGYYETICGGSGATATARGADAVHTHMTNTRLTDAEVIERRYPVRVLEFSIRTGSGGGGQQFGGCGIIRRLEFLAPLHVSMLSERRDAFPPFGMQGGEPGQVGCNTLFPADGSPGRALGGKFAIQVQPGDQLLIETPGGGGYG